MAQEQNQDPFSNSLSEPIITPPSEYNPLVQELEHKEYANLAADPSTLPFDPNERIPEPIIAPPSWEQVSKSQELDELGLGGAGGGEDDGGSDNSSASRNEPPRMFNEDVSYLSDKERMKAAGHTATFIIDGYEKLHHVATGFASIKPEKVRKAMVSGDISPDLAIPYAYDHNGNLLTLTVDEFVQEFNSNVKESFSFDPEFRTKVHPVLTRVLAKRGIAMTDEQILIGYFVEDAAPKVAALFQLKATTKNIFNELKAQTELMRGGGATAQIERDRETEELRQKQIEEERLRAATEHAKITEKQVQPDIIPPTTPPSRPAKRGGNSKRDSKREGTGNAVSSNVLPEFGNQENLDLLNQVASEQGLLNDAPPARTRGRKKGTRSRA